LRAAGATLHGALTPQRLADLAGTCVVGIIPYEVNEYTAGVFPMKLYEYLSAGMLVVSTGLPSIAEHASADVVVGKSRGAFLEAVARNLTPVNEAVIERRQMIARDHSWEVRGFEARAFARDLLDEWCDVR
jgi:teichuronic acid biosynthesis glycosyltransferase TuaH